MTNEPMCQCRQIQAADPRRHFKGCPLRKPLPEEDQPITIDALVETPEWTCPHDASHRGMLESLPPKCAMCLAVLVRDAAREAAK